MDAYQRLMLPHRSPYQYGLYALLGADGSVGVPGSLACCHRIVAGYAGISPAHRDYPGRPVGVVRLSDGTRVR